MLREIGRWMTWKQATVQGSDRALAARSARDLLQSRVRARSVRGGARSSKGQLQTRNGLGRRVGCHSMSDADLSPKIEGQQSLQTARA